ncbi:MAG: UPF0182 family protein [Actinobacteria bacterium]|nr:UPF0182 family protein [Actinomycetota bacterium]
MRRRLGTVVVVVVVLLFLFSNRIATFFTELWWFDALGVRSVYTTILGSQIALAATFGTVLAVLVAVNLVLAWRMRPFFVPTTPQQAIVERYRQMVDPYVPWVIGALALLFGATSGAAVASQWEPFLLWRNAQPFGAVDPQFGRDIGFYVFSLPWFSFVQTWLFTSVLLVTLLTVGAHYLLGGIRPESRTDKLLPNVKAHLSVLLAVLLAIRAWGYWLDRYMLNYSPRGQVTGASFTDVNAELPALYLLLGVSAIAIVMVLVSIRRRGFLLPGAAIALLVLASVLLQGAYPAAIQRLRVDPQELAREEPFIARNLKATREGYDLQDVGGKAFPVRNTLDAAEVRANEATLTNVRLWSKETLQTTYEQLQALRTYYEFADVDADRYVVDGELRQVMIALRQLDTSQLPDQAQTWQNQTLTYTHGFGTVASQVNTANAQGQPVFLARDIPPRGADSLVPEARPGIYYGEVNPPYSVVASQADELDFEEPGTNRQVFTDYDGAGGVALGSYVRRIAFALRFGDPNLVLSNLFDDDSRILFRRDIPERVHQVAPYLQLDADPYPVVLDERVLWVQDAYTTSNHYPYSERVAGWDTRYGASQINYVRNSVKAVVDAYDGTVQLFVVDEDDPVVEAWRSAFPDAYAPLSEAPEGLVDHFRYPEDLFRLQSDVYQTYHIPEAPAFYSKADAWEVPRDASFVANQSQEVTPDRAPPMEPFYLLMRLPGEQELEFVLARPYLPRNKPNMIAWLAARSDPGHYGELVSLEFPSDQSVLGPQQAQARIEQESQISEYISLRDQLGSQVIRGDMIVLPLEESILYIEPLFLENEQAQIPELRKVVIVMGDQVAFEDTLAEALASLVGADPPGSDEGEGEDDEAEDDTGADADRLLLRALEAFAEADEALQAGDLGRYQELIDEAQGLVNRAAEARGVEPAPDADVEPTEEATTTGTEQPSPTATEGG